METEASGLVVGEGGRVSGVRLKDGATLGARLVIAADGRTSRLREAAALPVEDLGAPIDVLWFRLARGDAKIEDLLGTARAGQLVIAIDRGDYFQCAYLVVKGGRED